MLFVSKHLSIGCNTMHSKFTIFPRGWEEIVHAKRIAHPRVPGHGKEPEELKESLCGLCVTCRRACKGARLGKDVTGLAVI